MLAILAQAFAADPVVVSGVVPDVAVAKLVVATGLPIGSFEPVGLDALLAGRPPALVGMGELTGCAEPGAEPTVLSEAVAKAEKALSYSALDDAKAAIAVGARTLACLSVPADPAVAGRLWFLAGMTAAGRGDQAGAWAAFNRARIFDPALVWDEDFPPDHRAVFDAVGAVIAAAKPVALGIVPPPREGAFWVDGRPAALVEGRLALVPGVHLVQVGSTTWEVTLAAAAPATLVNPSAVPPEAGAWASDPALRPSLEAVLSTVYERGRLVYVASADRTWRWRVGEPAWELVTGEVVPAVTPVAEVPAPVRRGMGLDGWLRVGGGAALVAGAGLYALGFVAGESAAEDAAAAVGKLDLDAYDEAALRHADAEDRRWLGAGVAAAGLVAGGAGMMLVVRW